jgi:hypothetical protein
MHTNSYMPHHTRGTLHNGYMYTFQVLHSGVCACPYPLGWKSLPGTNTLARYKYSQIMTVKRFVTLVKYHSLFIGLKKGSNNNPFTTQVMSQEIFEGWDQYVTCSQIGS